MLKSRPVGIPTLVNFETKAVDLPLLEEGQVKLKAHTFSVDPYMRGRMRDEKSYVAPYSVGEAIVGGVVAQVIESKSNALNVPILCLGCCHGKCKWLFPPTDYRWLILMLLP